MAESLVRSRLAPTVSPALAVACAAGLFAASVAAGSTGCLAEPLRVALTWLALLVAVVMAQPAGSVEALAWLVAMLGLPLVVSVTPHHESLLVVLVLGLLARSKKGTEKRVLLIGGYAAMVLAVYRLAYTSIPVVWTLGQAAAEVIGRTASALTDRPLAIGATFAGVDFLVLMAAFYVGWLVSIRGPRLSSALFAALGILGAYVMYLVVLALAMDIAQWLPPPTEPLAEHPYVPPPPDWPSALRRLLPWNLPALAALAEVLVVVLMIRWSPWRPDLVDRVDLAGTGSGRRSSGSGLAPGAGGGWSSAERLLRNQNLAAWALLALAIVLPVVATLSPSPCNLQGKTLVANEHGRLDWATPRHDHYGQSSAGVFGMLPVLVNSLGGRLQISPELAEEDLQGADVLLVLHPELLRPAQRDRIWQFVRGGGSMLVVADPFPDPSGPRRSVDQLLQVAGMKVGRDTAVSETGSWQHGRDVMAHPVTIGVGQRSGHFFADAGAAIHIGPTARPLIVGRWGWVDPGGDAAVTGAYQLEPGEVLGDLVLAAEQPVGKGTVIVIGDGRSLTNEGVVEGYMFAGRLLSYLANRRLNPQAAWRQAVNLGLCLVMLGLLGRSLAGRRLAWAAFLLSAGLAVCSTVNDRTSRVVPDGRELAGRSESGIQHLAYIDASHLPAYNEIDWSFDAINGLALTLMRNGYLPLALPAAAAERLERADMLVTIAPAKGYSRRERRVLDRFVRGGGIMICTIGAQRARPSNPTLADFGLRVPFSPVPTGVAQPEPAPMGHFRSLFLNARDYGAGDYKVGVIFYAGWPVEMVGAPAEVLVNGKDDRPIVVRRKVGKGSVILIGDTGFAMNKNLEYIGGEPFEGQYENAHFWRWMIARVTDQPQWIPPPPPATGETRAGAGPEAARNSPPAAAAKEQP